MHNAVITSFIYVDESAFIVSICSRGTWVFNPASIPCAPVTTV